MLLIKAVKLIMQRKRRKECPEEGAPGEADKFLRKLMDSVRDYFCKMN